MREVPGGQRKLPALRHTGQRSGSVHLGHTGIFGLEKYISAVCAFLETRMIA
jgi:hypothetical protein